MYIVISIFIIIISFKILKKANIDMNISGLNMISYVYYVYFILMSYIAQVMILENIFFTQDLPGLYSIYYNKCLYVWMSTSYAMIAFPLTIYLLNKYIFKRKAVYNNFNKSDLIIDIHSNSFIYCILSLFSIISIIYLVSKLNYIGVLNLFFGGYDSILRTDFTYNLQYNQYIVGIVGFMISQMLTYVWYIKWSLFKNKKYLIMFLIMLIFSIIILSMRLAKASIILYLFSILLLKIKINGRIKTNKIFFIVLTLFILLIFIYNATYDINLNDIFIKINHRILLGQNMGNYFCFICFPDIFPYLGFSSLSEKFSSLLGIPYSLRAARIIYDYAFGISSGINGTIVSLFIGDAWASFGLLGIFISPILVGAILATVYYTTYYSNKIEMWALYAYLSVNNYVVMDFASFVYPWSTYIQPALVTLIIIFLGMRTKKRITV